MTVSSSPHGEHPGRPGTTWETQLHRYEVLVPEDDGESPFGWSAPPTPNLATRRALKRAARRTR